MSARFIVGFVLVVVVLLLASGAMFTVRQTQQALVLQFGEPKRVVSDPGLHFKLPLVQDVFYYDARILDLDPPGQDMSLVDQRRINVDSFARYRIVDPLKFFQTVGTESAFRDRFANILNGSVRDTLGRADLADVLGDKRPDVMHEITDAVRRRAAEFGIEVVEVRIGRTDLTADTTAGDLQPHALRSRRRSRRDSAAAARNRSRASKADADRERTIIMAEAGKAVPDATRRRGSRKPAYPQRGAREGPGVLWVLPRARSLPLIVGRRHHHGAEPGLRVLQILRKTPGSVHLRNPGGVAVFLGRAPDAQAASDPCRRKRLRQESCVGFCRCYRAIALAARAVPQGVREPLGRMALKSDCSCFRALRPASRPPADRPSLRPRRGARRTASPTSPNGCCRRW